MKKVLIILGPTATGKTDLALQLAGIFNGEIISVDSRQVYKKLDIGTGKLPNNYSLDVNFTVKKLDIKMEVIKGEGFWEVNGVRIWMYDVLGFKQQYTVADYVVRVEKILKDIRDRNKLSIIVGGTGLYLRALIDGLTNLAVPVDKDLRRLLEKLSKDQLQKKLQKVSQDKWNSLNKSDRENPRRLVRAIELSLIKPNEDKLVSQDSILADADILKIGLTTSREIIYNRVDKSVLSRINKGMIEETEDLYKRGLTIKRMKQLGLEYGVLADHLEGKIKSREQLVKIIQGKIHNFVRRQLTWFKKEGNVNWFDISRKGYINRVEELVSFWYDDSDANQN